MVDVGLTHVIVKWLHRYYRSRSKPRGEVDLVFRGIRMSYNNAYRFGTTLITLPLSIPCIAICFAPHIVTDKTVSFGVFFACASLGLMALACLAPLEVFREFVVVTDEGLIRSNLFGQQTRVDWKEISSVSVIPDGNEITFSTAAGTKLKTSLCYNGWDDFLQVSARRLDSMHQFQIFSAVLNARTKSRRLEKVESQT